jgi:hypothetical protein
MEEKFGETFSDEFPWANAWRRNLSAPVATRTIEVTDETWRMQ